VLLLAGQSSLEAQQSAAPPRRNFAFFVIGPDSGAVRTQTSRWLAAQLASAPADSSLRVWDWREFLEIGLDIHWQEPWAQPPAPAHSGPAEDRASATEAYPWDLRRVFPLGDQRMLRRMTQLETLAQVIVESVRGGFRLTAVVVVASDSTSVVHLTATSGALEACASDIAAQLRADWARRMRALARSRANDGW